MRVADAIVALDGDRPRRLRKAVALAAQGAAPVIVVVRGTSVAPELFAGTQLPFDVLSFVPDPSTTRGEARGVARLVERNGWRRIIIVTSTHHIPRTRLIFQRALPDAFEIRSAGYDSSKLLTNLLLECAKLFLALTLRRQP